jgi:hypothetical protein
MKPVLAIPLASLACVAVLLGCGSDDDSDATSNGSGGGDAIVTGSAECNQSSMQEAVKSWAKANGGKATLPAGSSSYRCADGWAVAFPNLGSGESEVTVTAVFEAEGQFWIPKDRAQVCRNSAAQSEVPSSLYKAACQTN